MPLSSAGRRPKHPVTARLRPAALAVHLALGSLLLVGGTAGLTSQVYAQANKSYQIAAGPLGATLTRFAAEAGVILSFDPQLVAGQLSQGLSGSYGVEEGFNALLRGSAYRIAKTATGYTLLPAKAAGGEATLPVVTVKAAADNQTEQLPKPYAGGQVARGGRLGMLGNRELMDTPFNITSYTAELIAAQQARTVADVLVNDPSVRYTTSAGHMYENFRLRGFDINAQELAVNGMFGLVPYGHVPTEFIERVEVLKGPSALFTGMSPSGGVGGTINLVPKRAGDSPLTQVTVDYSSKSQLGTHLDVGRRFGSDQQFGVRFNGAHRDGDTDLDGQAKKRDFWSLGLDFRGEALNLSLDAYRSEESYQGGTPAMFSFSSNSIPKPPDPTSNQFKGLFGNLESSGLTVRGDFAFNEHLTAYAGLGSLRHEYSGFINGTHARNINASGKYSAWTTSQQGFNESTSAEAGLRGNFQTGNVGHQVVVNSTSLDMESGSITRAGATYNSDIYNPVTPILAAPAGNARKTNDTKLTSLALADTLSFAADKVLLTLGLRDQRVRTKSYNATSGALTANYDKSSVTPAAAVIIKPWSTPLSLYANYVEGLSQGGTVTDNTASNYQQIFAPYKTQQGEVGVKWEMASLTHTLGLFQITKPSLIKNGSVYTDDGEQRNRGLEWNVFGELTKDVRLLGGLAYTQGRLTRSAGGTLNGKTPIGTPEQQINIGAEWDTPWLPGLTLSSRATYTSAQYLNSANTQQVPGWTQIDLGVRYATRIQARKVVLRANISNLFDKHYWSGSFSESFATLGSPRSASLSATVDF